jgi:hypothetical protein
MAGAHEIIEGREGAGERAEYRRMIVSHTGTILGFPHFR